jgi:hypothetical protein
MSAPIDLGNLHRLGPRALVEVFAHLGAAHLLMSEIEAAVAKFAAIDPDVLAASGGDCMPPTPVYSVPR